MSELTHWRAYKKAEEQVRNCREYVAIHVLVNPPAYVTYYLKIIERRQRQAERFWRALLRRKSDDFLFSEVRP